MCLKDVLKQYFIKKLKRQKLKKTDVSLNLFKAFYIWGAPQSVCVTYELGVHPPDHLTVD